MYSNKEITKAKETIIKELYNGKSLKKILDDNKKIPTRSIIYEWLNSEHKNYDKEFLNNYVRAREDSGDLDADKIEDINEDVRKEILDPQQARIISENLKWIAGKKKPKKYGDKLDLTTGGDKITGDPFREIQKNIDETNKEAK